MTKIFIDANIFLGFWKLREGRLQSELLPALLELHSSIFVSRQLAFEVARNKLSVFLAEGKFERVIHPPALPEHLMHTQAARDWNTQHQTATRSAKQLLQDWKDVLALLAASIGAETDPVSQALIPLFNSAQEATAAQMVRARIRRERGNPPGKKADPLGDQLTWEQFLDALQSGDAIWIVTRDSDFCHRVNQDALLLNPLLASELRERGVDTVHVFDNLASAVESINQSGVIVTRSPTPERLAELRKELTPKVMRYWFPTPPAICLRCRSEGTYGPLVPRPSGFGGWTYQSQCMSCGIYWDSGEPYED